MLLSRLAVPAFSVVMLAGLIAAVSAQDYPTKTIRIVTSVPGSALIRSTSTTAPGVTLTWCPPLWMIANTCLLLRPARTGRP